MNTNTAPVSCDASTGRTPSPRDAKATAWRCGLLTFLGGVVLVAIGAFGGEGSTADAVIAVTLHAVILAVVAAAVFGPLVSRVLGGDGRPSRAAFWLGAAAVVSVVAFWSGLPVVLGGAATLLAVDARTRLGRGERGRRAQTVILVAGVAAMALGALASISDALAGYPAGDAASGVVTVGLSEYAFDAPNRVKGGVVSLHVSNDGVEVHDLTLARLPDDHTLDELRDALEQEGPPPWVEAVTAVPVLSPGRALTLTHRLQPGTYALVCSMPNPDGQGVHALRGMIDEIEVLGDSGASLPQPDLVISATDDGYQVPSVVEAGRVVVEFRNDGNDPHEFPLLTLQPGKSLDDVDAWFETGMQGPAPVTFVGGTVGIEPGASVFQELELEAGTTYTLDDAEAGFQATFAVS